MASVLTFLLGARASCRCRRDEGGTLPGVCVRGSYILALHTRAAYPAEGSARLRVVAFRSSPACASKHMRPMLSLLCVEGQRIRSSPGRQHNHGGLAQALSSPALACNRQCRNVSFLRTREFLCMLILSGRQPYQCFWLRSATRAQIGVKEKRNAWRIQNPWRKTDCRRS
jgi:hypothetical protein